MMSKYLDVTVPIHPGMAVYQGSPEVNFTNSSSMKRRDPYNVTGISMSSHTGTHIDCPAHFFQNGKTLDDISLEILIGPVKVINVQNCKSISRKILEKIDFGRNERILFKTDHSMLRDRYSRFRSNYVHMEVDACGYLVQRGIKLVGIDTFSVDSFETQDYMCHKVLLGAGVVIIEMVDLKDVEPGDYSMVCLPLKILKGDGAPARVILQSNSQI
jgi:arylformamidase